MVYNNYMNYLMLGNETYNLRKRKDQIIKETIGDDTLNLSTYRFNDNYNLIDVVQDCSLIPFMAENKVIVVENPGFLVGNKNNETEKSIALLHEYLQHSNIQTTLIIYCDQAVDTRKKVFLDLSKLMKVEKYELLSQEDFRHYVVQDLNDAKLKLDEKCLNELMVRLPISLENWKKELEKLILYPGKINIDVIKALVSLPLENNAFELVNGVMNHDLSKVERVYRDLLTTNKNDIMSLIGLLASQFRFMSQVKCLQELHVSNAEMAKRFNCKEYRVSMALKNCGKSSADDLLKILNDLSTLDQNIKKGLIDPIVGLELFIIKVTRK